MDIEQTIEYILNQQAQFVADVHSLQEGQRALLQSGSGREAQQAG